MIDNMIEVIFKMFYNYNYIKIIYLKKTFLISSY